MAPVNEEIQIAPGVFVLRPAGRRPESPSSAPAPDSPTPPPGGSALVAAPSQPSIAAPEIASPPRWLLGVSAISEKAPWEPAAMNHRILAAYAELCIGCRQCELACAEFHTGEPDPAYSRIKISKIEGQPKGTPTICMHCKVAKCERACPTRALYYDPKLRDVVMLNQNRCVRCLECVRACPFGAIRLSPDKEILKCDLCGGDPACAKVCPDRPSLRPPHWPEHKKLSCLQYLAPDEVTRFGRLANLALASS